MDGSFFCLGVAAQTPDASGSQALTYVALLVGMALLPFLLGLVTSFAKLMIVGGLLRQALGTPQVPPTSVLTGLALILTIYVMTPTARAGWRDFEARRSESGDVTAALRAIDKNLGAFLERNADPRNEQVFAKLRVRLNAQAGAETDPAIDNQGAPPEKPALAEAIEGLLDMVTRRAPAFLLTELTEAFQIAFLLFIPFLVVDLVVSNILLAMGMHMLQPVTISLPLKLLLFVLVDGWRLLLQGLVLGYA